MRSLTVYNFPHAPGGLYGKYSTVLVPVRRDYSTKASKDLQELSKRVGKNLIFEKFKLGSRFFIKKT